MTFVVDYDANVSFLHRALLSVAVKPVRTNATVAASGGGSVATSGGGSAHSHTISGQLVALGVAGAVTGATFLAVRLMWSRLEAVTDRFPERLNEKDRGTASAPQSVGDTLERLEGAMAGHERRAVERHEQQLARCPRERV